MPSWILKINSSFKIAVIASIPTIMLSKLTSWTITNQDYIIGVLACITIDHLIGSIFHAFKLKDFSLKKNICGLITKVGLCAASVILFEIIHDSVKEATFIYNYLKTVTRLIVILYPAGSAFINMSYLTNGSFPPIGWLKKIKSFNENIDFEDLKNKNN